jgi:protein arginine kinase activator
LKHKCDKCNRPATHHIVEIIKGQKIEKHLCDLHAAQEGVSTKVTHKPINELLTSFVKSHSGQSGQQEDLTCEHCGLTFSEFRESSVLGCPECYRCFETGLAPLLERAHEGATHHVGKVPRRAGAGEHRQQRLMRLRKQLEEAVSAENYEVAAKLRDQIRKFEEAPA